MRQSSWRRLLVAPGAASASMTLGPLVFAQASGDPDVDAFAANLIQGTAFLLLTVVAYYVGFAVALAMMARKAGRRDAWMAWVPVANVILMCRLTNRSGLWILGFLIPFVNLLVMVLIWIDLAKLRGKPAWLGVLILVPFVNLAVALYLASGSGQSAPPHTQRTAAAASPAPGRAGRRACASCGAAAASHEKFCGECGQALAPAAAPAPASTPSGSSGGRKLATAAVTFAAILGLGWAAYGWLNSYSAPSRRPPALPERMQGIVREFPVDSHATAPAKPASVVTQTFNANSRGADVRVPQAWLPKGVDRAKLPDQANTVVAAAYRAEPADPPVTVTVLETNERLNPDVMRQLPRDFARDVERATGGRVVGVAVDPPNDETYRGFKISSSQGVDYVLEKDGDPVIILIHASDARVTPVADRLAASVGNGEGLNDYPEMKNSIWTLPADQVDDFVLLDLITQTPDEIGLSASEIQRASAGADAQSQELMSQLSVVLPERFTVARYADRQQREWNALVLDYGGGGRAWRTWALFRWTLGQLGMESLPLTNGEARYADSGGRRAVVFHRGIYLVALDGPSAEPVSRFARWADRFQM